MFRLYFVVGLLLATILVPRLESADSPQDQYLKIYLLIQEAEKLELAGQKASARERYQVAQNRLEELQKTDPQWESTIVKYRIKYCGEKIGNLQGATDNNPDQVIPALPADMAPAPVPAPAPATPEQKLNSGTEPYTNAPVIETAAGAGAAAADTTDNPEVLKGRIRELEGQLASTKEKLESAQTEVAQLRSRVQDLEQQLTVARSGTPDEKMAELMKENEDLKKQLDAANQQVATFQSGGGESVTNLQQQLNKIQDQLSLARKENEALQTANEEFKTKLQTMQGQLDAANTSLATQSESLKKENAMLRDIVDRALKEQARREVAKQIALEELKALSVESSKLKTQLDILGSPVIVLTDEEKAMLRKPVAGLTVDEAGGNLSAPAPGSADDYSNRPRVPNEFKDVAKEANELFAAQKFDEAAAKYMIILNSYPDSLYALSNIAVVRFQQGNYAEAEQYLRKAVELAPQDSFSHSILGIALYQQGKYDDAVQMLSRAIALDPNDPKTHNYLGIAASQKGWQEAAEQECRKAIELDPNYGDAHFNLAVIYATQKPPAKELARRHYNKALELGVPRDNQLETMLK